MKTTTSHTGILVRDWCFHRTCLMMFGQSLTCSFPIKHHQTCLKCNQIVFEEGDTRSNFVVKHCLII